MNGNVLTTNSATRVGLTLHVFSGMKRTRQKGQRAIPKWILGPTAFLCLAVTNAFW